MTLKKPLVAMLMALVAISSYGNEPANPKREFRGAWVHTIFQSQYSRQSTDENQQYLRDLLDKLQDAGCNAVIFQVRPQADALYPSELEPWSRHLTGEAGVAPAPAWDPLQFMIDEAHARGMELHAWLNPYRVTTSKGEKLPKDHIYHQHPERFVKYADGKIYFDPGYPENREFIEEVVKDIITRYDVDAIHMDDYFYPYPVKGKDFPDNASYKKFGNGMNRGDWRRQNVNMLIKELHEMIAATKPWIRLGISPFGIWRNQSSDPDGSKTNGLQNYDELYADVTLWTRNGWVDYMIPQLYWELEHKAASAEILAYWWNDHANGRHMYIGQSVNKTMDKPDIDGSGATDQLGHKIRLTRELPNIQGNCWWPAYSITNNYKGVADQLKNKFQSTIAIVPAYTWLDSTAPEEASSLKAKVNGNNVSLSWKAPKTDDMMQQARAFVVYRFEKGEKIDIDNPAAIRAVTYQPSFVDSIDSGDKGAYTYVVTVLDRCNNESAEGVKLTIDL